MKRKRLIVISICGLAVILAALVSVLIYCLIVKCVSAGDIKMNSAGNAYNNSKPVSYINSVKGHIEKDTIVGNFTGCGIDSIYVSIKFDENEEEPNERVKYFAESNNPNLPSIELYGCIQAQPQLVYEGDVDGDGKDEWGYLHTWTMSQWRQYRIYNYDSKRKEWRHLYYDIHGNGQQLLHTAEYFRGLGLEIIEKGPKPGFIKINFCTDNAECELKDTIVKPTYTRISKDARQKF